MTGYKINLDKGLLPDLLPYHSGFEETVKGFFLK